jgi:hypothetical protein
VFSSVTPAEFHEEAFRRIARALKGATCRCMVSIVDIYRKLRGRLQELDERGVGLYEPGEERIAALMRAIARTAADNGMEVFSCAEEIDLAPYGIQPGKCVDDELISRAVGVRVVRAKDTSQRKACRCVASKDIGAYDTCPFGCRYCYATSSFDKAKANRRRHNPAASSLSPA